MIRFILNILKPKKEHEFNIKDVCDLSIDPLCQCGCGKTLNELKPKQR
jgi:hypothetical protein